MFCHLLVGAAVGELFIEEMASETRCPCVSCNFVDS